MLTYVPNSFAYGHFVVFFENYFHGARRNFLKGWLLDETLGDYPFRTVAKFSECTCGCQGVRNVSFPKNLMYALNEGSLVANSSCHFELNSLRKQPKETLNQISQK